MEGDKKIWQDKQFIFGLIVGLVIVLVATLLVLVVKKSLSGGSDGLGVNGLETEPVTNPAISTFELKKNATICKEDGKPVVYLFTTSWCPHCQWIKDTFNRVVSEYEKAGKIKAYNFDAESGDNLLTPEVETQIPSGALSIHDEFNPEGSIPTFVFGCKYFRIGNGYEVEDNLANEEKEFRAVIEDLIK